MKKLVLILGVMMMVAPAMADIVITIDNSVYPALVKYERTGGTDMPRAFALNIKTDTTEDINDVNDLSTHFWVHPGGINIVGGEVTQEGNAWADPSYEGTEGGLDTPGVTIEMASLYVGAGNQPPDEGTLCSFTVTGPCLVSITQNTIRGGVVKEDACSATADLDLTTGATDIQVPLDPECYAGQPQPDYDEWEAAGSPECWCYPTQCYGDADGKTEGNPMGGYYHVGPGDIAIMVSAWMVREDPHGPGISAAEACGDYSRTTEGNPMGGYYRVGPGDIAIMVTTWMVREDPHGPGILSDCAPGNRMPPP